MRSWILGLLLLISLNSTAFAHTSDAHLKKPLVLGLPYSGMDYFEEAGETKGFFVDVIAILEEELGIEIAVSPEREWAEIFKGLEDGEIDLLVGANRTPEREEWMRFTTPVHRYPYDVFISRGQSVRSLGDLDGQKVAFLTGDAIVGVFEKSYTRLAIEPVYFDSEYDALDALGHGRVQAFITSGGGIVHEYIHDYPLVVHMMSLTEMTSDLTISARKEDAELIDRIDAVLFTHREKIDRAIDGARVAYTRKILRLTDKERAWLESDGRIIAGAATDYLPFDHYEAGRFRGIAGAVLEELCAITGIEMSVESGTFDELFSRAEEGEIHIMNMAKSEERLDTFLFPRAFSTERDRIYGLKNTPPVRDVYSLEGQGVAVIEGFWHEEHLQKNLKDPRILTTPDIKHSLKAVASGEASYLIENPTVASYYINGLGYQEIIEKGTTSADSFLYFGVHRSQPEFASILNKAMVLIDYEQLKQKGLSTAPPLEPLERGRYRSIIGLLLVILTVAGVGLYLLFIELMKKRTETLLLKEREKLLYLDPLTGLKNRLYFNHWEEKNQNRAYPETFCVMDLNYLKRVNDSLGHLEGDRYLAGFGRALQNRFGDHQLFRMGGDEFLLVAEGAEPEAIQQELRIFQREIKDIYSVALGTSVRRGEVMDLETALKRADDRMYENKRAFKARDESSGGR